MREMERETREKLLLAQSKTLSPQSMGTYSLATGVGGGGPSAHQHQPHPPPHGEEEEFEVGHVMVMWLSCGSHMVVMW